MVNDFLLQTHRCVAGFSALACIETKAMDRLTAQMLMCDLHSSTQPRTDISLNADDTVFSVNNGAIVSILY